MRERDPQPWEQEHRRGHFGPRPGRGIGGAAVLRRRWGKVVIGREFWTIYEKLKLKNEGKTCGVSNKGPETVLQVRENE